MSNREKLLANAQKFLGKGQLAKAIGEYQKLVQAAPKDFRSRQKLAELLSRDKRKEEALNEYQVVARHYTDTGFYLKAIAVYKQMQKLDALRADICHHLAELNEKQGLIGNALAEYRNLVAFYEQNEKPDEVIQVLNKMLGLNPDNLSLRAKLAECYMASGRAADAAEQFGIIIGHPALHNEPAKLIKLYDRFLEICPDEPSTRLPLAKALLAEGQAEKAMLVLRGLLKGEPEDPEGLRLLAECQVAIGELDNARLTLQHLLKTCPDDPFLCARYLRVCLAGEQPVRARDFLEETRATFMRAGQEQLLRGLYDELRQMLPEDPLVLAALASLHASAHETDRLESGHGLPVSAEDPSETVTDAEAEDGDVAEIEAAPPDAIHGQSLSPVKADELDLDLDLDLETTAANPHGEPVAAMPEIVAAADEPGGMENIEVEIELDLGGMDELDFTPGETPLSAEENVPAEQLSGGEDGNPQDITAEDESADLDVQSGQIDDQEGFEDRESAELTGDEPATELLELAEPADSEPLDELEITGELDDIEVLIEIVEPAEDPPSKGEEQSAPELLEELEIVVDNEQLDEVAQQDVVESAASGAAVDSQVQAEIEEAEYYLQQGLHDDAERVVLALLNDHPDLPQLHAKLSEIGEKRQASAAMEETVGFSDLISGLDDDELLGATNFLGESATSGMVDDLHQELATEIDAEDTEAHFDLGIAYKEMGLYDDAIAEFSKAAKNAGRLVDCLTLKGQCYMALGALEDAEAVLREGLARDAIKEEARMTLNYELGLLYQLAGRPLEALECFQIVADRDLFFRDVGDKVKVLRKQFGLDEANEGDDGPQGNRDRVSYI